MAGTTIHVGKKIVQTVVGSDGPLAPGALTATSLSQNYATATVDPTTNAVTLDGISAGQVNIQYSAPGHQSAVDLLTVLPAPPLPTLVITDGPET